jgi:hypothetical protein
MAKSSKKKLEEIEQYINAVLNRYDSSLETDIEIQDDFSSGFLEGFNASARDILKIINGEKNEEIF